MRSMPRVLKFFKKFFGYTFCNFGSFEILSLYPNINSSDWLTEYVQWHIDKVFRETRMVEMASTLSSRTFLVNFWFLHVFVVVLISIRLFVVACW